MGHGPGAPKFIPGASRRGARGSGLCSVFRDGVNGLKRALPFTWPAVLYL